MKLCETEIIYTITLVTSFDNYYKLITYIKNSKNDDYVNVRLSNNNDIIIYIFFYIYFP